MELRSLGYVGIETTAYKTWEDIGPRIFGFGLGEPGGDGTVHLRLDDRHHRIALHPSDEDQLAYIGWEVAENQDLEEAAAELDANGFAVEPGSPEECAARHVERFIHLRDPAGLRHEIFWGAMEKYKSFEPPRPHSGFVTGDQGMGHVVLVVPDGDTMHDFLLQSLGFRLSDLVKAPFGETRFYHLNPRHHSLAVTTIPGLAGLHHIMVEVSDLDDLGITNDLVQDRVEEQKDMSYAATLGRHSTDRMVSIYVNTPSGFALEYGWNGLRIDETRWTATRIEFPAEVWGHKIASATGLPRTIKALSDTGAGLKSEGDTNG
jgi:extradiol dioxygenase